ncbi:NAD-dependent epimerase/dehydratase family protein [Flavobacterium sp.]|uniref:NAD-dependent epimerase/dehydratase family protein n=1 Tax=Flavobacterium sp. TaxID=239 RepID=UPI00286B4898|nr:NAD-dependent epimerase/dehydratase family protein [Flavobacterium sp.]
MILVTGATGLVGSHLLLQLLKDNQKVRALYRNAATLEKTKSLFHSYNKVDLLDHIEWIQADIIDVPSLEHVFQNIDYVYHCASLISFNPNDEKLLRKTNIEGTANIVNFCLNYKVKKLCYVSSIAALGDLKEFEDTITEATEWNPEATHSDYAISKYGAEMEVWRGQQEGLSVTIVNPGVILGSGFWKTGSGLLFTQVAQGLSFFTKGSTGFVCVTDVVKSMIQCMENQTSGARFIVVAENASYEKIVKTIALALKVKIPNLYARPWMTEIYWRIDGLLSMLFNKKRILSQSMARSLHQTDWYSSEKIKSELGFQFQNIESSIIEIAKYYPKQK